jgi:hypothetical protein
MTITTMKLREFLQNKNVPNPKAFAMVHSTKTTNLVDILNNNKLLALPCNVFQGESLCYLFVGRPAYKYKADAPATFWMLPSVFVIRFQKIPQVKRIFPFDSGAFHSRRLPDYITAFPLSHFDAGSHPAEISKIISIFFKDEKSYWDRQPESVADFESRYQLGPLAMEIYALLKLYSENSTAEFDDRAAAIEVQFPSDVPLSPADVLGVVVPEEMVREPMIRDALKSITQNVQTYPLFPLTPDAHFSLVYAEVRNIYKKFGILT